MRKKKVGWRLLLAFECAACGEVCFGHVVEFYPYVFFVDSEDLYERVCEGFGYLFALFLTSSLNHMYVDHRHVSCLLLGSCDPLALKG
jgi:hypothetical protein